jgi:hypothetical protein
MRRRWPLSLAVLVLVGSATELAKASSLFREPQYYVTGEQAEAALAYDWNRDGITDLLVSRSVSDSIVVLLGNGDGTFGRAAPFWTPFGPRPLAAADLNGDGVDDILVGTFTDGIVTIYLTDSTGVRLGESYSVARDIQEFALGDFNLDGSLDVAALEGEFGFVRILLNDGSGRLSLANSLTTHSSSFYGIAAGDVDHDGFTDLAVASNNYDGIYLYFGRGSGLFSMSVVPHNDIQSDVLLVDLDGDGNLDLVTSDADRNWAVSVFRGHGDGTFDPAMSVPNPSVFGPRSLLAGDFNGDGFPDVVAGSGWYDFGVFLNNGGGILLPRTGYDSGSVPGSFAAADFDGNGYLDLAVCNLASDSVAVFLNANGETSSVVVTNVTYEIEGGAVIVTWNLSGDGPSTASVYRLEHDTWVLKDTVARGTRDAFVWRDADVRPGGRHEYRLGVREGAREVFVGAVTVSVPSQWALTLAAVSPNPTRGDAWGTFTLPSAQPAALALYDVSGRRVLSREVGRLGVGHQVNPGERSPNGAGRYVRAPGRAPHLFADRQQRRPYSSPSLITTLSAPSRSLTLTPITSFFEVGTFLPT